MNLREKLLLAQITTQLERLTEMQRQTAKRRQILGEAATMLRMGRSANVVLALVAEHAPELVIKDPDVVTPESVRSAHALSFRDPDLPPGHGRCVDCGQSGDREWWASSFCPSVGTR